MRLQSITVAIATTLATFINAGGIVYNLWILPKSRAPSTDVAVRLLTDLHYGPWSPCLDWIANSASAKQIALDHIHPPHTKASQSYCKRISPKSTVANHVCVHKFIYLIPSQFHSIYDKKI